ncbi:hypothetical protein DFH09DRAFT_1378640, partial [Mycena vulgaris]
GRPRLCCDRAPRDARARARPRAARRAPFVHAAQPQRPRRRRRAFRRHAHCAHPRAPARRLALWSPRFRGLVWVIAGRGPGGPDACADTSSIPWGRGGGGGGRTAAPERLHRLFVQADGRTHDIVIGPESPKDHATLPS